MATQGLAEPDEAKVVRGEKNGIPVTDGIFPESKEFLLGYWIVDVADSRARLCHRGHGFRRRRIPEEHLQTCRLKSGSSRLMSNLSPE